MSSVPLPAVQCDLRQKRKSPTDASGTANISYGYKIDAGHVAKPILPTGFKSLELSDEEKKQYELFLRSLEFEIRTNREIKAKRLQQRLQEGTLIN